MIYDMIFTAIGFPPVSSGRCDFSKKLKKKKKKKKEEEEGRRRRR